MSARDRARMSAAQWGHIPAGRPEEAARLAARAIVRPEEWEALALLALERAGRSPQKIEEVRALLARGKRKE